MDPQETPKENPEIKLDKKSPPEADQPLAGKILFVVIGLLIIGSVTATYWRYMVKRDYIVQAQADCDPETERCFVWKCDPESDVEGEACTGDEEKDIWHYKIIRRNAKNTPLCDPNDENCTALVCEENEAECSEELCTGENVPEGETCNDPEQYLLNNPLKEEACAEDDEECLAEQEAAECEEGDEECLAEEEDAAGEECAPDDENCEAEEAIDPAEDSSKTDSENAVPPVLPM